MNIFGTIGSVAVGGMWKLATIASLAGMVASSAYLGYQWHGAAKARDVAVVERSKAEAARDEALRESGELQARIANQNASILTLARETSESAARYTTAMQALGPIKAGIKVLAERINAQQSVTCEQALSKQRRAIEGLKEIQS